jgi:hypothetical protein
MSGNRLEMLWRAERMKIALSHTSDLGLACAAVKRVEQQDGTAPPASFVYSVPPWGPVLKAIDAKLAEMDVELRANPHVALAMEQAALARALPALPEQAPPPGALFDPPPPEQLRAVPPAPLILETWGPAHTFIDRESPLAPLPDTATGAAQPPGPEGKPAQHRAAARRRARLRGKLRHKKRPNPN